MRQRFSDLRRQVWRYPLWATLWGAVWPVLALCVITTDTENPVVVLFVLLGMCGGPVLFIFGLGWLLRIRGRRRQVHLAQGQWVAYPARAAIMRQGPLRQTVVGLEITPTATVVIYPEQFFCGRIRRLVEREGQLLVLVMPPGAHDWFLYAGPSGRPVFPEIARAGRGERAWGNSLEEQSDEDESRGLVALARARGSAL